MSVNKIGASRRAIGTTCKAALTMRRLSLGAIRAWHHTVDARAFLYLAFNGGDRAEAATSAASDKNPLDRVRGSTRRRFNLSL
jgi:hypothetical protein